ncbi:MAG: hypothetical protein V1701_00235 [Planctomycetota bacterium]
MNDEDLIQRMPDDQLSEAEHIRLDGLIENDRKAREDIFSYMLLESELTARYNQPFRFNPSRQIRSAFSVIKNRFFLAAASLLIVIIGALLVFYSANKPLQPPGQSEWRFAMLAQAQIASSVPVQLEGMPLAEGHTIKGSAIEPPGGLGNSIKPGSNRYDDESLANAISTFSGQFEFEVILPKNLPTDLSFIRAKRISPVPDTNRVETAMLIYTSAVKKLAIFEDLNTGKPDSIPGNIPPGARWHQRIYGKLRITIIGIGFLSEDWQLLAEKIDF